MAPGDSIARSSLRAQVNGHPYLHAYALGVTSIVKKRSALLSEKYNHLADEMSSVRLDEAAFGDYSRSGG
jgi:hypothetical protein